MELLLGDSIQSSRVVVARTSEGLGQINKKDLQDRTNGIYKVGYSQRRRCLPEFNTMVSQLSNPCSLHSYRIFPVSRIQSSIIASIGSPMQFPDTYYSSSCISLHHHKLLQWLLTLVSSSPWEPPHSLLVSSDDAVTLRSSRDILSRERMSHGQYCNSTHLLQQFVTNLKADSIHVGQRRFRRAKLSHIPASTPAYTPNTIFAHSFSLALLLNKKTKSPQQLSVAPLRVRASSLLLWEKRRRVFFLHPGKEFKRLVEAVKKKDARLL